MRKRTLTITLERSALTRQEMIAVSIEGHEPDAKDYEIILLATAAIDNVTREMLANSKKKQDEVGKPSIILASRLN